MHLINILNIPSKYRNRYEKIKLVKLYDLKITETDKFRIFSGNTGYITEIAFNKNQKIDTTSEIRVNCTCKSFEFEFAEVINKANGLLYPKDFSNQVSNKIKLLSGCKHLIFLARHIFERRSIFDKK
jgi:hypothetical protein